MDGRSEFLYLRSSRSDVFQLDGRTRLDVAVPHHRRVILVLPRGPPLGCNLLHIADSRRAPTRRLSLDALEWELGRRLESRAIAIFSSIDSGFSGFPSSHVCKDRHHAHNL